MARRYYQGKFKPRNPKKYLGDPDKIEFRSSWEKKVMNHFDLSSSIIGWSSEEVVIPYLSPKDGKYHRYFVDFLIVTKDKDGNNKITLIEVKPKKETKPPTARGKKKSRFLKEAITFEVNQAKWKYARAYCESRGWTFMIMTEDHIY